MVQTVEKIEVRKERPVDLDEMGKVLLKARDVLRNWGWAQNAYQACDLTGPDDYPRVCMMGALNVADGRVPDDAGIVDDAGDERLVAFVRRLGFGDNLSAAFNWNDTTDRTQQEVEERLERAAYNL